MNIKKSLISTLAAFALTLTPPPCISTFAESDSITIALNDRCTAGSYGIGTVEDHGTHTYLVAHPCSHGSYRPHNYDASTGASDMSAMTYYGMSQPPSMYTRSTVEAYAVNNQTGIPISFTFSPPLYQGKYIIPGTEYTVSWTGDQRHIPIKFSGRLNSGDRENKAMYSYFLGDSYSGSFTSQLSELTVSLYEPTDSAAIITLPNADEMGVEISQNYNSKIRDAVLCPYSQHPEIIGDHPDITTSSWGDNASHSGGTNFTCHTCNRTWSYSVSDAGSANSSSSSSRKYVYLNFQRLQLSTRIIQHECQISYVSEPCPIHGYIGPHAVSTEHNVWGALVLFVSSDYGLTQDVDVRIDPYSEKYFADIDVCDEKYHYAPQFGYSGGAQAKAVVGKISIDTDDICVGYTNYVYAMSGTSVKYTPVTSVKYKYKVIDMTYTEDGTGKAQRVISEGETNGAFTFSMPPAEIKIVIEASKLPQTVTVTDVHNKIYNSGSFNLGATVA